MTTSQLLAMLNKQVAKEQAKNRELELKVEELEGLFGYECECNKQFVETQNECERLKILLTNALVVLEENGFGGKSFAMSEIGLTEKEYTNIMGDNEND